MTRIPSGILSHGPWDEDPDWYPGEEDLPIPRDRPEDVLRQAETNADEPSPAPTRRRETLCAASRPHRDENDAMPHGPLPPMRILQCAYEAIMQHLTGVEPEAGGMLLGPKGSPVVTHYVADEHGRATAASFTLDATGLNGILKKFLACDMDAKGLVHSHPLGCTAPSIGDLLYVRRSFGNPKNKDVSEFLLPIVCGGRMFPFVVAGGDPLTVRAAELIMF